MFGFKLLTNYFVATSLTFAHAANLVQKDYCCIACAIISMRPAFVELSEEQVEQIKDSGKSKVRQLTRTSEISRTNRSRDEEVWHNAVSLSLVFSLAVFCAFLVHCARMPSTVDHLRGLLPQWSAESGWHHDASATALIFFGSVFVIWGYRAARRVQRYDDDQRMKLAMWTFPGNILIAMFSSMIVPYFC